MWTLIQTATTTIRGWANEALAAMKDKYAKPDEYKGSWEECYLCGGEKMLFNETAFCVSCDNREDLRGTWFTNFAEVEGA